MDEAWAYGTKWMSAEGTLVLNTENDWKDTWTTIVPQKKKIHIIYLNS